MKPPRRKKTRMPRLTMLAYSRTELQRFHDRMEFLGLAVYNLTAQVDRMTELVARLEARSRGASKANQTRRAPANDQAGADQAGADAGSGEETV